ncbi:hypothetical protein CTN02_20840 [Lysinibacillus sphaericus]|nr:hypothetical protein CTN02_20840 [Lysinibacillus sphaericus]
MRSNTNSREKTEDVTQVFFRNKYVWKYILKKKVLFLLEQLFAQAVKLLKNPLLLLVNGFFMRFLVRHHFIPYFINFIGMIYQARRRQSHSNTCCTGWRVFMGYCGGIWDYSSKYCRRQ